MIPEDVPVKLECRCIESIDPIALRSVNKSTMYADAVDSGRSVTKSMVTPFQGR